MEPTIEAVVVMFLILVVLTVVLIRIFAVVECCRECCEGHAGNGYKALPSDFVDLEAFERDDTLEDDFIPWGELSSEKQHFSHEIDSVSYRKEQKVCQYCSKKFGKSSSLKNHQKDTDFGKCRLKKYKQVALTDSVKIEVKQKCNDASLDQSMYQLCKDNVIDLVTKLLEYPSNYERFSIRPDREGSTKTGLKTRKPVEFDFSVPIILYDTPEFVSGTDGRHNYGYWCNGADGFDEKIPPGCAKIILGSGDIRRFENCCSQGVLSPTKLRLEFQRFLSNAAKAVENNGSKIHVCKDMNGPAVRLVLKLKSNGIPHHIDVDLTPKVDIPEGYCPQCFAQGFDWPRDGTYEFLTEKDVQYVKEEMLYLVPKKNDFWSISFANYENAVLNCFSNTSTEKKILRCMKVRLEIWQTKSPAELKVVSSYLLKEVFLSLREELPDKTLWTEDQYAERYNNFVQEIRFCFNTCKLPDYFVPTSNLMEGKDKSRSTMIRYLDEELKKIS